MLISGRLNALLFLLSIGLFVGISVGVLFWLVNKFSRKWLTANNEMLVGFFLGLFRGGFNAAAQHYVLRFWLWRTHAFPWKAKAFLDDSTTRILLRRVEGEYSFTHRLLLDYFADLNQ